MRMSPRSRWATRSSMLLSTTAAGTISQTARGLFSLRTRSASELAPTALSRAKSATALALNRRPPPRHAGDDAFAVVEDRRARHQHIRARGDRQRSRGRVDSSVHLEVAARLEAFDHFARARDLRQRRVQEMLVSESRV